MQKVLTYILFIVVLFPTKLFSQTYGNEWIKTNQLYYRFSIPASGMYKVTGYELQQAGIPVSNFSPQNIQLFYNGKEIPCYINGESEGVINYLLFYTDKNTGWFDLDMYDDPLHQTNPNHSVITDTASVFLTWNTSFSNKRFTLENDINFSGYTPKPYCWVEAFAEYTTTYYTGLEDCEYVEGEGWFDGQQLNLAGTITKKISTPDFVNSGLKSTVDLALISFSKDAVLINNTHHITITAPGFELDTLFNGYRSIKSRRESILSTLDTSISFVFKSIDDQGAVSSKVAISYINFKYTRGFTANKGVNFKFSLPASPSAKSYIEVVGFISEGTPFLFDIVNGKNITVVNENGLLKALVPASASETKLLLVDSNYFLHPAGIHKVTFANHSDKKLDYLIISHPKLWESAQAYADYRNAYLVNIEELYNQFGYGIQKHPMAIRNFLNYVYNKWADAPGHLFIIGKAVESYQIRNNILSNKNCLIPTMGQYGSDALLSNRIGGSGYEGAIPTGRLAAQTNSEVLDYLNKVQEFEANPANEWMKRAIHFGGGANSSEQNLFKSYLYNYETILSDSLFGGFVSTFLKTSSDPIVISKTDSIKGLVNGGVSLMTFFGHGSAVNGFDQNIDEPSAYTNKEKYPLMLANSCYTGNIHLNGKVSTSEAWVIIPNKGAIAYLAVVGSGYANYLNILSNNFYSNLSLTYYGKSLGEIVNETSKRMQQISSNRYAKLTIHEYTLHGDPALVLNSFPLPDLTLNSYDVTFSPKNITTEVDSFYIQIICTNQGKTTSQPFSIEVTRFFQTGKNTVYYVDLEGLYYKDTIKIKLPVDNINGLGNNKFTVHIDASNKVSELDELNNSVDVNTFISTTDLVPAIPFKYSITRPDNMVLKASSVDAFAKEQATIFQIDTTYLFNSPMLVSETKLHTGGIIEWKPAVSYKVGETYFWRVAKNDEEKKWSQSSFYLNMEKVGWNQSNYGQMRDNTLQFLEKNDNKNEFEYTVAPKKLICKNIGTPTTEVMYRSIAFGIDGIGNGSSCGAYGAMILVVIDSTSLIPWQSNYAKVGEIGHGNDPWCSNKTQPENYFIFYSAISNIEKMVDFVENQVPDGNYLLIYSFINGNFASYNEKIRSAFDSWGANNVRFLSNYTPYIFFAQKGDISTAQEVIGAGTTGEIELYKELKGNFTYGTMESPLIGPAKSWSTLNWDSRITENNINELAYVRIFGSGSTTDDVLLADSVQLHTFDLSAINVLTYPYLKLQFYSKDEQFRTPSQLKFWEVVYEPVTDLAINPQKGFEFKSDTLKEGEAGSLSVTFENIGNLDVDSTRVNYWIQNDKNEVFPILSRNIAPLKAGTSITDKVEFSTLSKPGNQSLWIEFNPKNTKKSATYHREQYSFNNLAQKPFYVQADELNPMLDVTFDGRHIMDGDLVSSRPEIVIQLKDENSYILLNDTSLFSFYTKSHQTGIEQKISINNNPNVNFIPAKLPTNKAQIIYSGQFPDDGTYELRVQAKDKSGNESGSFDYLVSFQVINESTISNVFNYPNPFSTSTRFVFELTGSELPDAIRIEILTVTGKVVKVIYADDLGAINIGKNITEYSWNGTDMYGDPLANGVYFYRVNARLNGKEIKVRDTGSGQYFKNGFGKMYLMR